jgi:hypothetical protein
LAVVQFLLVALTLAAAPLILVPRFGVSAVPHWVLAVAGLGLALAVGAATSVVIGRNAFALVASGACALVFYVMLMLGVAPQLKELWLSERTAALVSHRPGPLHKPIVAAGYAEPSLVFLLGDNVRFSSGRDAAAIAATTGDLALIEDADRRAFLAGLAQWHAVAASLGEASGLDYSKGRKQHLILYRVAPAGKNIVRPNE